jgi:hypothetical protein
MNVQGYGSYSYKYFLTYIDFYMQYTDMYKSFANVASDKTPLINAIIEYVDNGTTTNILDELEKAAKYLKAGYSQFGKYEESKFFMVPYLMSAELDILPKKDLYQDTYSHVVALKNLLDNYLDYKKMDYQQDGNYEEADMDKVRDMFCKDNILFLPFFKPMAHRYVYYFDNKIYSKVGDIRMTVDPQDRYTFDMGNMTLRTLIENSDKPIIIEHYDPSEFIIFNFYSLYNNKFNVEPTNIITVYEPIIFGIKYRYELNMIMVSTRIIDPKYNSNQRYRSEARKTNIW